MSIVYEFQWIPHREEMLLIGTAEDSQKAYSALPTLLSKQLLEHIHQMEQKLADGRTRNQTD